MSSEQGAMAIEGVGQEDRFAFCFFQVSLPPSSTISVSGVCQGEKLVLKIETSFLPSYSLPETKLEQRAVMVNVLEGTLP